LLRFAIARVYEMDATISGLNMKIDTDSSVSMWKGVDGQIRPFAIVISTPNADQMFINITAEQAHDLLIEMMQYMSAEDFAKYILESKEVAS